VVAPECPCRGVLNAVALPTRWSVSGGLVGRLCGSAEVLGGLCLDVLSSLQPKLHPLCVAMTRNDDHLQDALPTQKLEWVTPKISLMGAGDTEGNKFAIQANEVYSGPNPTKSQAGPS
jgi:hypothetical protein